MNRNTADRKNTMLRNTCDMFSEPKNINDIAKTKMALPWFECKNLKLLFINPFTKEGFSTWIVSTISIVII
jgi:hypothetical protein